jgi:hypothetical protein
VEISLFSFFLIFTTKCLILHLEAIAPKISLNIYSLFWKFFCYFHTIGAFILHNFSLTSLLVTKILVTLQFKHSALILQFCLLFPLIDNINIMKLFKKIIYNFIWFLYFNLCKYFSILYIFKSWKFQKICTLNVVQILINKV